MVYHKISQDFCKLAKLPPKQQKMETSISENQMWGGLTFPYSFLHWSYSGEKHFAPQHL